MTDMMTSLFGNTIDTPDIVIYTDDFTDTDNTTILTHTSNSGFGWVAQSGFTPTAQAFVFNNAIVPSSTLNVYRANFVMPSADYEVESVFRVITNTGFAGLTARASATANTFYTFSYLNNQWLLRKSVAGTVTTIGTAFNQVLTAGQNVTVKLVVIGDMIQGWIDGILRSFAYDTSITEAGSFGLRMPQAVTTTTGIHVDSITAKEIQNRLLLPTDLNALYYIDHELGITSVSNAVSTWNDLTINARHVTQATGSARPLITSAGISFDGVNDTLFNALPFMFNNPTGIWAIIIMISDEGNTNRRRLFGEASTTTFARYCFSSKDQTPDNKLIAQEVVNDANQIQVVYGTNTSTIPHLENTFKIFEFIDNKTQMNNIVNCVADPNPINYTRTGTYTFDRFSLGALIGSTVLNQAPMVLKTYAVFNGDISDADKDKVRGALAHKHGLQAWLPNNHPYKNSPPII